MRRDLDFVNEIIYRDFLSFMSGETAGEIADALQDEVWEDIQETANPNTWGGDDVEKSMERVLRKKLLTNN